MTVIEQLAPGVVCTVTSPLDPRVTGDRTVTKTTVCGAPEASVSGDRDDRADVGAGRVGAVVELENDEGALHAHPSAVRPMAQTAANRAS